MKDYIYKPRYLIKLHAFIDKKFNKKSIWEKFKDIFR